jgi:hypothetical protein
MRQKIFEWRLRLGMSWLLTSFGQKTQLTRKLKTKGKKNPRKELEGFVSTLTAST